MMQPVIEAKDLGVKFVRNRRRKLKMRETFIHGLKRQPSGEYFWPFRNVSFEIHAGEAVGVVGRNGTGKSTLLRTLAGVLYPDEGSVVCRGRIAPLLQLSAGFSDDLTGRENVHLLGTLHGLSRAELRAKFDEIVDFAEVGNFIDTPLRHYSSGMKVRLGFAVISQLSHPILLVDEALAVGDRDFRTKCYTVIEKMLADGRTLVFVSHSDSDLTRFCKRGLYIADGKLVVDGSIDEALSVYNAGARS
ncbi:ABC transporter ATP-binding protein [Planosporangium sp. 12N6]|uniref:ABC transporter ATP-binding protein n=1 Tax=Planosporangium spinosum TaxID=3402278 RepID=UPI003CF524BB